MIYVIGVASFDNPEQRLIKIGFSDNWEVRKYSYFSLNPLTEFLFTVDNGVEQDEKNLHAYFKEFRYQDYGKEWFNYDESIIDFFKVNDTIEKIRQIIGEPVVRIDNMPSLVTQVVQAMSLYYKWGAKEIDNEEQELARLETDDISELLTNIELRNSTDFPVIKLLITEWLDIYNRLSNHSIDDVDSNKRAEYDSAIEELLQNMSDDRYFHVNLKSFCNFLDQYSEVPYIEHQLYNRVSDIRYWFYYNYFGTARCSAMKFQDGNLSKILTDSLRENYLRPHILDCFKVGSRYDFKYIKDKLKEFYSELGFFRAPKATDLSEWFELKKAMLVDENKKRVNGFEILSLKEEEEK